MSEFLSIVEGDKLDIVPLVATFHLPLHSLLANKRGFHLWGQFLIVVGTELLELIDVDFQWL